MARNPFEETARSGGRPGYQSPTNYRGESPQFSRGLLDVRYPVDSAVQEAHRRPSNRQPLLNQPPMAGPSQPSHFNPRMRHINPRGMMGGLGGLQQQANLEDDEILRIRGQYGVEADEAKRLYDDMIYGYDREVDQAGLWQDWKRIFERTGNSDLADSWIQSQQADASGIMEKYNQFTDKFGDIDVSGEGIEYEKDFDVPWGGTGTIEGQYGDDGLGGGIKFSWPLPLGRTAGMDTGLGSFDVAYRPGTYGPDYDDDDYGPFNPPSVYEMDDDWLYDPDKDEYEFDYIHGNLVNTGLA